MERSSSVPTHVSTTFTVSLACATTCRGGAAEAGKQGLMQGPVMCKDRRRGRNNSNGRRTMQVEQPQTARDSPNISSAIPAPGPLPS